MIVNWEMIKDFEQDTMPPFDPWIDDDPDAADLYHLTPKHIRDHFLYWDNTNGEGIVGNCGYHFRAWYEDFGRVLGFYLEYLLDENNNTLLDKIYTAISPYEDVTSDYFQVDRWRNGILPPSTVNIIAEAFDEIDIKQVLSLLKNYPFRQIIPKEKMERDYRRGILKDFLRRNINTTKEQFNNAVNTSDDFLFDPEYESFYVVNSIETFKAYFDFYKVFFEAARQGGCAVYITRYPNP